MGWPELEDALSDACDEEFAELFRFWPMHKETVNSRETPDPTRQQGDIISIWSDPSLEIPSLGAGSVNAGYTDKLRGLTTTPRISVDVRQFLPTELPRQRDRVHRVKTGTTYSISDIKPDGQGRLLLLLAQVVANE